MGRESGAKGRRHGNSPLAVDLVHVSGQKQFHLLPPTLPHKRPARGRPGSAAAVSPQAATRSLMGRFGISWDRVGGQAEFCRKSAYAKSSSVVPSRHIM